MRGEEKLREGNNHFVINLSDQSLCDQTFGDEVTNPPRAKHIREAFARWAFVATQHSSLFFPSLNFLIYSSTPHNQ
jgi:hypothetical protein